MSLYHKNSRTDHHYTCEVPTSPSGAVFYNGYHASGYDVVGSVCHYAYWRSL